MLLERLCRSYGVAGFEDEVRQIVMEELRRVCDDVRTDAMGNVVGFKRGKGRKRRKLMLAAHMDEIGFLVTHVDEKGFLRLDPVGGINPQVCLARRVLVFGKERVWAVVGSKPPHIMKEEERKKAPTTETLFADTCGLGKKAKDLIPIGSPVAFEGFFDIVGDCYVGKAMDDRVGVYVMIEALKEAKSNNVDVYAVATAQEEVGLRGAVTSAFGITPDIGIALDVTIAADVPGAQPHQHITHLGDGVAIKIKDSASISNPKLVRHLQELAERHKIPWQAEILPRGGTDAGAIQRPVGAAVATLSVPTRYVHSPAEVVHKRDVKATIDLLARFIEDAHKREYTL